MAATALATHQRAMRVTPCIVGLSRPRSAAPPWPVLAEYGSYNATQDQNIAALERLVSPSDRPLPSNQKIMFAQPFGTWPELRRTAVLGVIVARTRCQSLFE